MAPPIAKGIGAKAERAAAGPAARHHDGPLARREASRDGHAHCRRLSSAWRRWRPHRSMEVSVRCAADKQRLVPRWTLIRGFERSAALLSPRLPHESPEAKLTMFARQGPSEGPPCVPTPPCTLSRLSVRTLSQQTDSAQRALSRRSSAAACWPRRQCRALSESAHERFR
jgi:hypothetical protein